MSTVRHGATDGAARGDFQALLAAAGGGRRSPLSSAASFIRRVRPGLVPDSRPQSNDGQPVGQHGLHSVSGRQNFGLGWAEGPVGARVSKGQGEETFPKAKMGPDAALARPRRRLSHSGRIAASNSSRTGSFSVSKLDSRGQPGAARVRPTRLVEKIPPALSSPSPWAKCQIMPSCRLIYRRLTPTRGTVKSARGPGN